MRAVLLPLLATACDALPRIDPTVEDVPGSALLGSVILEDQDETGPTVLLLSAQDDPMPPLGTGFPITFTAIGASGWEPRDGLLRSKAFAFTNVAPGGYFLNAIMDLDGNFNAGVGVLATPTCGDLTGWHRDGLGDDARPVPVRVGEAERVDGVLVGPLVPVDAPQPTAVIAGDATLSGSRPFRLDAVAVDAMFGDLALTVPAFGLDGCTAGFRFVRVDADADGDADASPLVPIPGLLEDRWPRIVLQWLGEPLDTDGDGAVDSFDRGDVGDDVTIAGIGDPAPADEALPAPGEVVDVAGLSVRFTGLGQRLSPDGSSEILLELPPGAYGVTVLSREGQIWSLPNELDDRLGLSRTLPPPGLTSGSDPRMGGFLTLPP